MRDLLEHVARRSTRERPSDVPRVVLHREHQDPARGLLADPLRGLEAVGVRHHHVQQHDVGRELERLGDRLFAVSGLGNDGQVGLLVEQQPQAGAHDRVIVRHKYRDRFHCYHQASVGSGSDASATDTRLGSG
jgi:hypothetical protein